MITLCYIEGINEVDTPWFDTIGEQTAFFDKAIVWHDDESYYPPYFMNTIRLSSEDIPFNDSRKKVNYCFLDYEGKRYYYFIDSIDYVTDDLVEITIEMDTIQTYLFDMLISKPTISRMAIQRWGVNGDTINRDYIRENLSIGNMVQKSKEPIKADDDMGWIIITASDEIPDLTYSDRNPDGSVIESSHSGLVQYVSGLSSDKTTYRTNGLYTYVIPYSKKFDRSQFIYVQLDLKDPFKMANPQFTIEQLSSMPNVMSMKYVPDSMFANVNLSTHDGMPLIRITSYKYDVSFKDASAVSHTEKITWNYFIPFTIKNSGIPNGFVIDYPSIKPSFINVAFDVNFGTNYPALRIISDYKELDAMTFNGDNIVQNRAKGVPYSSKFVPAMIDESYMRITLGDTGTTCVAPLYYALFTYVYPEMFATIDGAIAYFITFASDSVGTFGGAVDDPHGTAVINENAMEYTLRTDPWKQYQVTHKGSIITDWIASGAGAVTKVAGVASMAGVADKVAGGSSPTESSAGTDYSGLTLTADGYSTGFTRYRMPRFINVPRRGEKGRYTHNELYPI